MNPSLPLAYGLMRRTDNLSSSQTSRKAAKNAKDFYMFQFLVSYGSTLVVAYLVGKLLLEGLKGCNLT